MKTACSALLLLDSLLFSSCQLAEQWQEARKLDEEYARYVERCEKENETLVKLKKAAAEAAGAQRNSPRCEKSSPTCRICPSSVVKHGTSSRRHSKTCRMPTTFASSIWSS